MLREQGKRKLSNCKQNNQEVILKRAKAHEICYESVTTTFEANPKAAASIKSNQDTGSLKRVKEKQFANLKQPTSKAARASQCHYRVTAHLCTEDSRKKSTQCEMKMW